MSIDQELITSSGQKLVIKQREDGFINATQLCKAGGKRLNNWSQLDSTKELIGSQNLITGIPVNKLLESVTGRYGETYIHPDLAIQLAQWISPHFALQVSRWIRNLLTNGSVSLQQENQQLNNTILCLENDMILFKLVSYS